MATSKGYLEYVLEQLSGLPEISHRAMMGEYVLYYRNKVIGGIYDDRLLLKPTKAAETMLPDAERDIPCRIWQGFWMFPAVSFIRSSEPVRGRKCWR